MLHFGAPCDLESYVQETGRAGRDGLPALALLLAKPNKHAKLEKTMAQYIVNTKTCRRKQIFKNFDNFEHRSLEVCCDICTDIATRTDLCKNIYFICSIIHDSNTSQSNDFIHTLTCRKEA